MEPIKQPGLVEENINLLNDIREILLDDSFNKKFKRISTFVILKVMSERLKELKDDLENGNLKGVK